MKKNKSNINQFRQGDVLIERVTSLPGVIKKMAPENGRVILAHGEVTGHAHEIESPKLATLHEIKEAVRLLGDLDDIQTLDRKALVLAKDSAVIHQEHATIPIKGDSYVITRQREYSPEAIRNVAD
jgi:hypothetical protein